MYGSYMPRLAISEVRRNLPALVRRAVGGEVVEILVRGKVVAEIAAPRDDGGVAARRMLALSREYARRLRRRRGPGDVAQRKNEYLAGVRR